MAAENTGSGLPGTALSTLPSLAFSLQPAQQMDLSKLSSDKMSRVNQITASVSFTDTNSLMTFGADAQRALSQHLDQLLEGMRTSEAGSAGEITIALATTIKDLNLSRIKEEVSEHPGISGMLGKIPVVGEWFSALRTLQMNRRKITDHLATIEARAQTQLASLRAMNSKLDRMAESSIEHIQNLELFMAAGQILIKKARVEFESRRLAAEQSRDVIDIARLRDFAEQLNTFETRVVRIHLAHSQSIIAVPEIRTSQTAGIIEMNNVMDSLLFDLPNLKRAILSVAALAETAKASKESAARHTLSRELNKIGSEELQATYLKAKASQGDFAADVAALSQSANKLLETIALGRKLDQENALKREKAIADLTGINQNFTSGLLESGNRFLELQRTT